jgi:hypothetical protein
MIKESPAENVAIAFIDWLRTERYTDYTIDCHIRRLLFVSVLPAIVRGYMPGRRHDAR